MIRNRTISKQKAIELIANLLFSGKKRNDIIQELANSYKISESFVDKCIKEAKVIVTERNKEVEEHLRALIKESREDMVKRLGLEQEAILTEYKKLAFFNIKSIFTIDGGMKNVYEMDDDSAAAIAGIESYDEKEPESGMILGTVRKIKVSEKRAALDSICKVLGYMAPTKIAPTDADGNDAKQVIILNGKEIEF